MSRWIGNDHIDAVLAAADAWREACFMADGSLFGDGPLWTRGNIRELKLRFLGNPIEGDSVRDTHQLRTTTVPPVGVSRADPLDSPHMFFVLPNKDRGHDDAVCTADGARLVERHPGVRAAAPVSRTLPPRPVAKRAG